MLSDVARLQYSVEDAVGFRVSGRGELHLSILIEKMRREGYEFQVTRPQVILKEEDGRTLEPFEKLTVDVDEQYQGAVIEKLGKLKGQMEEMSNFNGMARMVFSIPTRGLLGYRSQFMTDTKGMGMMATCLMSMPPMQVKLATASMVFLWLKKIVPQWLLLYLICRSVVSFLFIPARPFIRGRSSGRMPGQLIWLLTRPRAN